MYMGPIVAAETTAPPVGYAIVRTPPRPPSGVASRFVVGVPVLALATVVMVPWLVGHTLVAGALTGVRSLPGAPRALLSAIDYAGRIALGR
ncbi:hypothetical protein GCM10022268_10850 [Sphingomonas cynarae]|uniref:Uncharacterized protein n=1 Tax=Sphingomonas cynarae TaxID=930197 RepID=A0ABP7DA91_9SPHN